MPRYEQTQHRKMQQAAFTDPPAPARRLIRKQQQTVDMLTLYRLNYGTLVSRVAGLHPSINLGYTGSLQEQERQSEQADTNAMLTFATGQSPATRRPKHWGFFSRRLSALVILVLVVGILALALRILAPLSATWSVDTSGDTFLESVAMTSPSNGWAVGSFLKNAGGYYGVIWRYHNEKWTPVSSPTQSWLRAVTAFPNGEAWAVGRDGTILHELEGQWTSVASSTTDDLNGIAMISPVEGWAVGGAYQVPIALGGNDLASLGAGRSLFMNQYLRPGAASHQSEHITCRILHYTGGQWIPVPCPTSKPLFSVCMLPDGEAWAVGMGGIILHERQGSWTQVHSPTYYELNSVAMSSPSEGWAVGDWGAILHCSHGVWVQLPTLTQRLLASVAVSPSGDGWIVGDDSTMLHEHQGTWKLIPSPTEGVFFGITLLPHEQEGWAVGADHLIIHEHNERWSVSSAAASGIG